MSTVSILKDFSDHPKSGQLFDSVTEASFTMMPHSRSTSVLRSRPLTPAVSLTQQIGAIVNWTFKILFIVSCISVCYLALHHFLATSSSSSADYCGGNGWIAYRDETCFKLVKKWATRDDAESACRLEKAPTDETVPHLASIKTPGEQSFLANLLFSQTKLNVWIGARKNATNGTFLWEDGFPVTYTNLDSATDLSTESHCVEMLKSPSTSEDSLEGKWRLAVCQQANYFVCQKTQRWTFEKLQTAFLANRKEFIPIGFTYVQLPSQGSPIDLWPHTSWIDISADFSGAFLRIAGNGTADFGTVQEENAGGQIETIRYDHETNGVSRSTSLTRGECSAVGSIDDVIGTKGSLQFCTRKGELRPRNMAVKIWKRIK